ncbi:G protein-regulated inducer of neurite outgrowth 1 [Emydura macquarii macquarii]|uniref:G protein-regulated inducer of neurite outgrowth 1 n=1 Tax=Emydura macquarii macquarii TaxID=1129001 RepID=UPI00352B597F
MGSAKEPGSLQLLAQGAVAEDVCRPEDSSPGCLHSSRCGAGQLTMRNCCVPELSGQGSQESRAEAPATDKPPEPAAGGRALVLQGTCAGVGPPEKGEESLAVAVSCLGQNGERRSGPPAPPDGSSIPHSPPAGDGAAVASAEAPSPRLLPEPCLKGHGKDLASAPAALKHVAFREPANRDPQPDGAGAAAASPELAPVPPAGLQDRRQEQAGASQGDGSVGAPGAACLSDGGAGAPCGGAGGKVPPSLAEPQAQLGSPTAPGAGSKGAAALPSLEGAQESAPESASGREAASGPETRLEAEVTPSRPFPAPLSRKAGPAGSADARPEARSAATQSVKGHGPSGESRAAPAEAGGGTGPPQSTAEGSPAQEQRRAKGTEAGPGEEAVRASRTVELLSKTYSFEVTPPPQDAGTQDAGTQDAGTQAGTRVSLVSVAVSPINPPDGSMAFTFHSRGQGPSALASPGPELKPSKKDAEMQVSIPVESRSVATGPMTPVAKSPQASYPEVRVKGAQEEPPEPIREVSWDEKGMTWEVYGASVEVEVLGMAIQKHLEKQIEEHGRQTVMTPQSTRASSIKGAPHTGEVKRPPSMFRALLRGMRRPRCCSRAGPAAE